VHHYNSTQYCKTETVFSIFPFLQVGIADTFIESLFRLTTLQVVQLPRSGSLRRVHERVDRFSAADLQSGLVRYDHEDLDSEEGNNDDQFMFVVCVESRCADGVVGILVTAGGPPPSEKPHALPNVVSRMIVVDRALGSAVITPNRLNTTCSRCPQSFRIIYSVISSPMHGHLESRTENKSVASFSQRDLDLGHVIYQHDDSFHLSDSGHLSVSVMSGDGDVIWSSDVQLDITIKPRATDILLSVPGNISVVEGERTFITENQLRIQHGDDVDDVEIVVLRLPVYGRIQVIREHELRCGTSFLLSEVSEFFRF